MRATNEVIRALKAKGVSVDVVAQGKLPVINGVHVAEEHVVYRTTDKDTPEKELIGGLVDSITRKRSRRVTIRGVEIVREDGHSLAYTCLGYVKKGESK